eukprot:CAMPEP_0113462238 /NCGR_PEP_ID=MMETSP0014_2-20120614/11977_1 /TAXON_ID=2857 /ORGANISM="Nitzschia sp." /LENGTH=414 /DNA_ID=CAMNT_0000354071 /DNA_START=54 /DNA_END=1298 /DNA_ORIENTATION=+ /assembly_acc=CAM_ASM_000159
MTTRINFHNSKKMSKMSRRANNVVVTAGGLVSIAVKMAAMVMVVVTTVVVSSSSSFYEVQSFTPSSSSSLLSLTRRTTTKAMEKRNNVHDSPTTATSSSQLKSQQQQQQQKGGDDGGEPDLFDYFDPLLSPHSYPNGVSPDNKPDVSSSSSSSGSSSSSSSSSSGKTPFGINYYSSNQDETVNERQQEEGKSSDDAAALQTNSEEPDLFEYFDPLLSPHSYPNGISPDTVKSPQELEVVKSASSSSSSSSSSSGSVESSGGPTDAAGQKKRVGILLMDHGSRNEASNKRLQAMAKLYQLNLDMTTGGSSGSSDTVMIVRAAHMEITKPSIPDGLQTLLDAGVDEIICHPYFLSPGRHVVEDIPEIIDGAVRDMKIGIPVRTTDPVGSNTQMMLGLIHSSVASTSQVLRNERQQH